MSELPNDKEIREKAEFAAGPEKSWPRSDAAERAAYLMGYREGARWMRLAAHAALSPTDAMEILVPGEEP